MQTSYVQVDKEGFKVDVVLVDTVDGEGIPLTVPDNLVPPNTEKRLWKPKWNYELKEWEEGQTTDAVLDETRKTQFTILSQDCELDILGYFDAEVRGVTYSFSYDREAQSNFTDTMILFSEGLITEIEWTVHTESSTERIMLSKDDFMIVASQAFLHKNDKISRLRNVIQKEIDSAQSVEEIESVEW